MSYRSLPATPDTGLAERPFPPASADDVGIALSAACAAVGGLDPDAPQWVELLPLVHELADAVQGRRTDGWPDTTVVAARRLARATAGWRRSRSLEGIDAELVLAIVGLVEVVASGPIPGGSHR